ncbi:MAG: outer membrane protein/peptidoglycan-associated protein [Flavipsychrobacter sp.]|nr:outer membrane protein/peptidoglycan-associated protein [Flavipsychrobacter sp.]
MNKFHFVLIAVCVLSLPVGAQRMFGVATGNYNATSSLYLDPANMADSRNRLTIDLVSINAFVDNDMGTISKEKLGNQISKGKTAPAMNNIMDFKNPSGNIMAPYAEVRGPGFMWSIDHKNSIALTTRVRGNSQFSGIDQGIYRAVSDVNFAKHGTGSFSTTATSFHWNSAAWGEIGGSYARVLMDEDTKFLSAGITLRYLGGISYSSLVGSNLDADYNSAADSLRLSNVAMKYSTNVPDQNHATDIKTPVPQMLGRFLGKGGGSGVGADIGVSYEYRPDYADYKYAMDGKTGIVDHSKPRYKIRLSAAITDIGAIYYGPKNNKILNVTGNGYTTSNVLSKNVFNFKDFTRYTKGHGFITDTGSGGTMYHMPTAMVLGADYRFGMGNWYLNVSTVYNLASRTATGAYFYNQITLTPRYETRLFSLGIPVTYSSQSHAMKMGFGVCMAGFFIGSDDVLAVASDNQYGFNAYMGGFIPVNYKKPSDRDGDLVSDKKDMCPDVPGLWVFQGCPDPDKDKDGIPDSVDKCPSVRGMASAQGCPDKDADSIADGIDRCPDKAGTRVLKGCPDKDGDGIVDVDDACPDQPGTIAMKGCPDTDGDGIPDNIDKCPTVAGAPAAQGCPEPRGPELVKGELKTTLPALAFETGKAIIKKTSYPRLNETVKTLKDNTDYSLVINGYTDNVGSDEQNLVLSEQRAASVKTYFVNNGIAPGRLETAGMGNTNPIGDNNTAAGRAKNRRVEMILRGR